jgi:hypothetical protein
MAELEKSIPQIGAVDMLTITQIFNNLIRQHEEAKRSAMRVRLPNTSYNVGDKVIALGVANFDKVLRCEKAGVSGSGEFPKDYNTLKIGDVIQDGSLTWAVVDLVTIPDFEENPVVSVNGKTGTVNLTPSDIGASAENHGHDDLFAQHKAELATTTNSGHVKIDGKTIINENGIIKSIGGTRIGSIFSYPASVPPEGAYLLNGQIIYSCDTIYPQFWQWANTERIRKVDSATYESELATTGVCGAFVVDEFEKTVRLPSLTNGTVWGGDGANIGQSLGAGLPNITGSFSGTNSLAGTGAFERQSQSLGNLDANSGHQSREIIFDASRVSSIYGNSDTVQPPAVCWSWCIQIYNTASILSQVQVNALANEKANKDLSNTKGVDFVVAWGSDFRYKNEGTKWYRKYKSGWVEQGGELPVTLNQINLHFPIIFANSEYSFTIGAPHQKPSSLDTKVAQWYDFFGWGQYRDTDMINIGGYGQTWYACGWAQE